MTDFLILEQMKDVKPQFPACKNTAAFSIPFPVFWVLLMGPHKDALYHCQLPAIPTQLFCSSYSISTSIEILMGKKEQLSPCVA